MRKYALVNNNTVTEVMNLEDADYPRIAAVNQMIVDIEDVSPVPQVGWVLVGNALQSTSALPIEEILRAKVKKAREFGTATAADAVDRIGASNILSGKTEAQIIEIMVLLDPIKKLMEGGALNTAKTQLLLVKPSVFVELHPEIDRVVDAISGYLAS